MLKNMKRKGEKKGNEGTGISLAKGDVANGDNDEENKQGSIVNEGGVIAFSLACLLDFLFLIL